MKCMIAFSCLLAVASAGFLGNAAYGGAYSGAYNGALGYSGAYNGALGYSGAYNGALGYAGVGSSAVAYNAPLVSAPHPVAYSGPLAHGYGYAQASPLAYGYAQAAPLALASEARLVDPIAIAAGAPLPTGDTVEVAAAKAVHFQAHAAAKGIAYSSAVVPAVSYAGYAQASPLAYGYANAGLVSEARLVDPVAIAAGAPLPTGDTVEVAAAKALHYQAHVAAKAGHHLLKRSPGYLNAGVVAAPLAYSAPIANYGYSSIASPLAYSGYSSIASPLAYSGYSSYGYGGRVGAYYG